MVMCDMFFWYKHQTVKKDEKKNSVSTNNYVKITRYFCLNSVMSSFLRLCCI